MPIENDMPRSDLLALLTGPLGLAAGSCAGKVVVITGTSLEDWQRAVAAWKKALASPPPGMPARLDRLAAYYRGVPAETALFTRDADLLRQVQGICDQRLALIEEIKAGLR